MVYDYADLIDNLYDGVYFVDKDRRITYWNKAAERITGYASQEVVGSCCSDNILIHVDSTGRNLCLADCPLAATIEDGVAREMAVYLHHKNGHRLPVQVRTTLLKDENGAVIGSAELFTDTSSESSMSLKISELEELALIDNLTKLANRHHIGEELKARFDEKERYGLPFGILFMDIDNFKQFNDTYGHVLGDLVLKTIAATLRSVSRPFDLIGRWGGEEFLGIIRNVNRDILVKVGERFRVLVEKTYLPSQDNFTGVTISLGATIARDNDTPDSILKRADVLLFKSKDKGKNCLTADE